MRSLERFVLLQASLFGDPLLIRVGLNETMDSVAKRIQQRLGIKDEDFAKWEFRQMKGILTSESDIIPFDDVVSDRFKSDNVKTYLGGYGANYLGLQHAVTHSRRPSTHTPIHAAELLKVSHSVSFVYTSYTIFSSLWAMRSPPSDKCTQAHFDISHWSTTKWGIATVCRLDVESRGGRSVRWPKMFHLHRSNMLHSFWPLSGTCPSMPIVCQPFQHMLLYYIFPNSRSLPVSIAPLLCMEVASRILPEIDMCINDDFNIHCLPNAPCICVVVGGIESFLNLANSYSQEWYL